MLVSRAVTRRGSVELEERFYVPASVEHRTIRCDDGHASDCARTSSKDAAVAWLQTVSLQRSTDSVRCLDVVKPLDAASKLSTTRGTTRYGEGLGWKTAKGRLVA